MARRLRSRVHGHNVTGHLLAHKQTHGHVSHHHTPDMKIHPRAYAHAVMVSPEARKIKFARFSQQTFAVNFELIQLLFAAAYEYIAYYDQFKKKKQNLKKMEKNIFKGIITLQFYHIDTFILIFRK